MTVPIGSLGQLVAGFAKENLTGHGVDVRLALVGSEGG
jgi:hypothetical protein